MVGFNQAIHYFRKILSLHVEFAGASTLSNRENDGAGAVAALGGVDRENPIRAFGDGFDFFAFAKPEIDALKNLVPESEQLFLGKLCFFELAVDGELDRAGHD